MTMLIPLDRIQLPKHYIREKPNQQIINAWADDLKEKGRYFFPPIEVWIPPDGLAEGKTHELIDGRKRFGAAEKAGMEKIPAVPLSFKKPEDAFARQYLANEANGEFLTKGQRNYYVQVMRTSYKLNLAAIAKITKLSKAQVSRIARGITRAGKEQSSRPSATWTARGFLDGLLGTCDDFREHDKAIQKYCKEKYGPTFMESLVEALQTISDALTEALKAAEKEAGAGQGV